MVSRGSGGAMAAPEPCVQAFMAALYVKSRGSRYGPHDVQLEGAGYILDGSASWGAGRAMAAPDPEAGAELRLRGATEDRCVPVRRTA